MKKAAVLFSLCFLFGVSFAPLASALVTESTTDTFADASGLSGDISAKKFLFFGDSITVGSQDSTGSGGFVGRLNHSMKLQDSTTTIINKGLSSDTVSNARTQLQARVNDYTPDYVFCLFGTNDFRFTYGAGFGSDPEYNVTGYEENYTILIQDIIDNNTGVNIALGTIPPIVDYRQGTFYNQTLFNTAISNISTAFGLDLIDIHDYMFNHGNISFVGVDDIHPNPVGYHWIASQIYDLWFNDTTNGVSTGAGLQQSSTGETAGTQFCPYYNDAFQYSGTLVRTISSNTYAGTRALMGDWVIGAVGDTGRANISVTDDLTIYYSKSATGAIFSVTFDGVPLGSIDTYNAASLYKQSTLYPGVSGYGELVLEITGKNGASGGYFVSFEAAVTNYTKSYATAVSKEYTSALGSPTNTVSYSASRNVVKRVITIHENEANIECSRNGTDELRTDAYAGYLGRIGVFGPSDPELADQDTLTYNLIGFGTARFFFAISTFTGWNEVYLDGVKQFDVNLYQASAQVTWSRIVNVSLGTYGEHNITFVKGTNSTALYPLAVEYNTFDINFYTSTDGSTWTLTNSTSATNSGATVYFKFIFFGDEQSGPSATVTSVTVSFTGESTTVVLFGEITDTLMAYIPLVIVLGIIFTFMVKFGIAQDRRKD